MNKSLRIISRNSNLALCQAHHVLEQINKIYPKISITVTGIKTVGDKILDRSLNKIGGKGLFTKELESELLSLDSDLAVHSAKDLSVTISSNFSITTILKREDATDAFISNKYPSLDDMPDGAIIGTSSERRCALLNKYYPKIQTLLLRGNINTRLEMLGSGKYDGIILATAGLNRLDLSSKITQRLDKHKFIPSIGQGALAVEFLSKNYELQELLAPLIDHDTAITVAAEREVGRILKANCGVPIAVHAQIIKNIIYLDAYIADRVNNKNCQFHGSAPQYEYLNLATNCANSLINQGANAILQRYI